MYDSKLLCTLDIDASDFIIGTIFQQDFGRDNRMDVIMTAMMGGNQMGGNRIQLK